MPYTQKRRAKLKIAKKDI